ncbi:DEAD/DEAH box helicase [Candidatus Dojkabacteria bacterium]|nr:DEAD/DEAH box helicase [Candidatus Dojkabacteria bacterium]
MFGDVVSKKKLDLQYPLTNITGGLVHLYDPILKGLRSEIATESQLIVVKNWTSDIERYLNSLEELDKNYTYAAVEIALQEANLEIVPKVEEMGQYSRVGDVVSFWPIGYQHPLRIEFFDQEIEKIYSYDEIYGSEIEKFDKAFIGDIEILDDHVEWENVSIQSEASNSSAHIVVFGQFSYQAEKTIEYEMSYPQLFYGRLDLLEKEIDRLKELGWEVEIKTTHESEIPENLKKYIAKNGDLSAGFIDKKKKLAVFTDRELFGTLFITKEKQKKITSKKAKQLLDKIEGEVEIEDYLVHEDHGIGIYKGIVSEDGEEYLNLSYAEDDELLIPFNQLHKITKYIGISDDPPKITTLDKVSWQRIAKKTRKSVIILAQELASHYAKIETAEAPKISIESGGAYEKFVGAFGYEETPDQKETIRDVLADIASENPMNRLIVGDVGFGKTEVAMRAAFKVVQDGYQVIVLCPTTVLAMQHYKVFRDRFEDFGVKVGMISRISGSSQNKETVDKLNKGEIDIVVGTHRLLSSDVKVKKLGLVIVDEEQKFGVRQKEKLKKVKYGAHILSMTATPIPRTLSMALSEIQDISIISSPPQGRKSVETSVEKKDWDKIRATIKKEIERGGQVYFVHNQVRTIESVKAKLQTLLPKVRFVVGHGQMKGAELEKNITDFYEKKYDVLICTTIIENGIDMPNVNTIIIDKAQNFGLGQLYQLRGRVGRSESQAYAYLFFDGDLKQDQDKKYIQRLKAILENQELGAGFKIASRDLEIRGAGNLLGKEQHGNISKVGLALYMQMLAEEIEKIRVDKEAS